MFASSMKILTLNTNNASPTTAQSDNGPQFVSKILNSGNHDEIGGDRVSSSLSHKTNKRDQKHNNKIKFVHGNNSQVQQHLTQQHLQTQKYHHKNNNGNKLKNQHYSKVNSNSNNAFSVNRKKYYQQPQHYQQHQQYHQQQPQHSHYITTVQKSISSSPTIVNNNNSNLVKNQNYNNTELLSKQEKPKQLQQSKDVRNLVNFSTNLTDTCTCLLQQNNCDEFSLPSFSPGGSPAAITQQTNKTGNSQSSNNICINNSLKSSLTSTTQVQKSANTATACVTTSWKNFNKLPQQSANFEPTNTNALASNYDTKETLAKNKSSVVSDSRTEPSNTLVLKGKSYWKNSNSSAGAVNAVGTELKRSVSSSEYSLDNTTPSSTSPKDKEHNISDTSVTINSGIHLGENTNTNVICNEEKYSTKLASTTSLTQLSKQKIHAKDNIEMTTSLASSNCSINTSVSSSTKTYNSKSSTQSHKPQQGTLGAPNDTTKPMLKTLTNNCDGGDKVKATTTNSSLSTNTSSVTSCQNSYSIDFLHSVGVKMTGVDLRSPGNQISVHNAFPYTGMSTNQRQPRYQSNPNSSNNGNQLQHYHHHQPSQLTIASFLHKDFLGVDKTPTRTINNNRGNSSSGSRNGSHYHDRQQQSHFAQQQQPTNTRYHHNFNATAYQQQTATLQHTNYGGGGGVGVGYNGGGHRSSGYAYKNYQNSAGESAVSKSNTMAQIHSRQLKNNIVNFKNSVNNSQLTKKATCASSTTSNGSLSSSKSFSSNSSNISNRQLQTTVNQNCNKSASNLNLAIETLPSKMLNGGNQRGGLRGHHNNHHSHHQHLMMNSPNVLQHQNYYNLTYVTTDSSANSAVNSRGCSPSPQSLPPAPLAATNCNSPKTLDQNPSHTAMLINFNASQMQYPRYQRGPILAAQQQHQQYHQFPQHQQTNILNKKVFVPLSVTLPSPSPSPTLTSNSQQTPPENILCCSQLDEASTAAAAASSSCSSSGVIAGNECDSDNSPSRSPTQLKYESINSAISSSSSIKPQQVQQLPCLQPATAVTCTQTTPLHSPLDYCGTTSQMFSNMQVGQQPQLPQFYGSGDGGGGGAVISLLNLPTKAQNNFLEEDYLQQQPLILCATPSQKSPDNFNISVSNHSNNSSGYWSPSFQNNQFIYHQFSSTQASHVPTINSSSSSCGSSSASISPRLPNDDIHQQNNQRLQNNGDSSTYVAGMSPSSCSSSLNEQLSNIFIGNGLSSDSVVVLTDASSSSNSSVSDYSNSGSGGISINSINEGNIPKGSTSQLMARQKHRLIAQVTCQSSSSSASSLSNATVSTLTSAVRARKGFGGENGSHTGNGCNSQFIAPSQISVGTLVENSISGSQHLPPTATQHFYSHHQPLPPPLPPHNLLYSNPQVHHMRALSSSSVHDFFTHTPPDRFLARAHLIEAKEAPASLLNNSKWDHLSQAIWKKFINSQQTEETFKQKMRLWRYLYVFIKNAYPRYGLYLVGSTISGFGSDSSDVDMCLVSRSASSIDPRLEALFNLTVLRDCLIKSGQFENFNLIEAKVPILRFSDRVHQLEVDLNFNNCVGIRNTHLLYCYSQLDWRLRPLVLVTKLWAQYHDINNAKNMTISSYSLVLMVIHFLQYAVNPPVLPCLHDIFPDKFPLLRSNDFGYVDMNEAIGPYESKNTQTVGELFLLFLRYYSYFNYAEYAISVRTGGLLPIHVCRVAKSIKNDVHQWKELCIEEPFDLTNTARSVYDSETFERVKSVFLASWQILHERMDLNSVFSTISLPSPSSTAANSNLHPNTNTAIDEVADASIVDTAAQINYEQYDKDLSVPTVAVEEYKALNSPAVYNNKPCVVDDDECHNNRTATNNALIIATSTARKMRKLKDLNLTLTPHQVEEFSFSPTSSSSIKTGANNINGNNNTNNNRAVSALAS